MVQAAVKLPLKRYLPVSMAGPVSTMYKFSSSLVLDPKTLASNTPNQFSSYLDSVYIAKSNLPEEVV